MPVASWIAIAFAASIPVAVTTERKMGYGGRASAAAFTGAAVIAGLIGILG